MNQKKVKKLRKALRSAGEDQRTYQVDKNGTVSSDGLRKAYRVAKRAAQQVGLA